MCVCVCAGGEEVVCEQNLEIVLSAKYCKLSKLACPVAMMCKLAVPSLCEYVVMCMCVMLAPGPVLQGPEGLQCRFQLANQ